MLCCITKNEGAEPLTTNRRHSCQPWRIHFCGQLKSAMYHTLSHVQSGGCVAYCLSRAGLIACNGYLVHKCPELPPAASPSSWSRQAQRGRRLISAPRRYPGIERRSRDVEVRGHSAILPGTVSLPQALPTIVADSPDPPHEGVLGMQGIVQALITRPQLAPLPRPAPHTGSHTHFCRCWWAMVKARSAKAVTSQSTKGKASRSRIASRASSVAARSPHDGRSPGGDPGFGSPYLLCSARDRLGRPRLHHSPPAPATCV